jgi:small GTP-binding protein
LNAEVFDEMQSRLVMREMETLSSLIATLDTLGAASEDVQEVKKSIEQLKDLFLLVIVGEFNSGKSSFLNAMLGKKWLEEGVTPTTGQVNILRNGKEFKVVQVGSTSTRDEHVEVHVPVPWLKQISLVDTPGTNAVVQGHQEITEDFVPRSDLVLFVTSCDRAFTESERAFLELVKQYNKKVVVVLSKIDMLEDPAKELPQILQFVNDQTKRLFGFIPQIFPVSSRKALRAKTAANAQGLEGEARDLHLQSSPDWAESRFGPLESYILHSLNAKERGKLKLENPIGIAEHLIKKYQLEQSQKAIIIKEDVSTLQRIDNELEAFRAELMTEYAYHEERIDNVLLSLNERARNYLDDQIVITNACPK